MSGGDGPVEDWHLIAWESYDPQTRTHDTTHLRPAVPGELEAFREAVDHLSGFLSHSAYADFLHDTNKLHEAIEEVEGAWALGGGTPPRQELRALHGAVKAWLAAVRSFDDRTSEWLSKRFGRAAVYDAFKGELRAVYDRNFAYRLACALRNASEHTSAVLNHVRVYKGELPEGAHEHRVELGFDAPQLLANFTKLKAKVRDELRDFGGLLSLEAVVGDVTQAVERVVAVTLLAAEAEFEGPSRLWKAYTRRPKLPAALQRSS